jgi:hypothetical protein
MTAARRSTGFRSPVVCPEDDSRCDGDAFVDVINSVFYETFNFAGTDQDPFFPSLLSGGPAPVGRRLPSSRGYLYAQARWNKLVIERQRQAGTLPDPTLTIDRGTEGTPSFATFPTSCGGQRSCSSGRLLRLRRR